MAYTSAELVGQIITVAPGDDLTAMLLTAEQIVNDNCLGSGYDDDKLEKIERWVTAHLYAVWKRRRVSEGVSGGGAGVNQTFDGFEKDLYFNNTMYGQTAVLIDDGGNLAALQNNLKHGGGADVFFVGTNRGERP